MKKFFQFKDKKEAEKWFEKRQEAMKRLSQHEDFVELVKYWEIEYSQIDQKIDSLKGRELEDAVLARSIIRKHLDWISTVTI